MRVVVCTPTLTRYDCCVGMIKSACMGTRIPDLVAVIDNGNSSSTGFEAYLQLVNADNFFEGAEHGDVEIVEPEENLGVAKSWNVFLNALQDDELAIIVNDDIIFGINDIAEFEKAAIAHPNAAIFLSGSDELNSFSCFAMTKKALELVGPFDELFERAYFEDNDWWYRCHLSNAEIVHVKLDNYHVGSATLKSLSEEEKQAHHTSFRKNQGRYTRKWGGLPANEVYYSAFNE